MQAHLHLAEAVGAAAMLGLGRHTFLPDLYIDILVSQSCTQDHLLAKICLCPCVDISFLTAIN